MEHKDAKKLKKAQLEEQETKAPVEVQGPQAHINHVSDVLDVSRCYSLGGEGRACGRARAQVA